MNITGLLVSQRRNQFGRNQFVTALARFSQHLKLTRTLGMVMMTDGVQSGSSLTLLFVSSGSHTTVKDPVAPNTQATHQKIPKALFSIPNRKVT